MKKKFKLASLAASVLLMGVSTFSSADTIKIALAGPVTGPAAQYGEMLLNGANLAIENINKAGGVNGSMLEGVVYDDACDPKQAVAVANKIVNDEIQFVVGHLCSSSTQPASDIYEDEGVLMVTPASTSPAITEAGHQMVFRTIGLDSLQGPKAANYVTNSVKPKSIAIIHDKQQYGEGLASSVKATLESQGSNIVMFEGITVGDKDFSSLIAKMQKAKVDFVYYGGYHAELGLILRQASEKGLKAQFMGPEGVANDGLTAVAGDSAEGLLVTLPPSFDSNPLNKSLVDALKAKNQDASAVFVLTSYSAVQVMVDAMKATGGTDTDAMQKMMRTTTFNTPTGQLQFNDKGDLTDFEFVVYNFHADASKTLAK